MPCMYLIHSDPDVYPEPERFRPERFLGPDAPTNRVWLPFGAGPRHCIGYALSMMSIKVLLRTVLRRVELRPTGPSRRRSCGATSRSDPSAEHGCSSPPDRAPRAPGAVAADPEPPARRSGQRSHARLQCRRGRRAALDSARVAGTCAGHVSTEPSKP